MMPLPQKFDENEWFLLICIILAYTIVFILPKRFPFGITILLMLYGSIVARLSDHFLASPKLDLYNLMDTPKYDFFDLITYLLYAPFSYLFIYYYEKRSVKGFGLVLYLLICTSVGTLFEWVNKEFHVFTYKGWHIAYSFTIYLGTQCLTILFYHFVKHAYTKELKGVQ